MVDPTAELVAEQVRTETDGLLPEQIRTAFWNILIVAVAFIVGDLTFSGRGEVALHLLNLAVAGTLVLGLGAIRLPAVRQRAAPFALVMITAVCLGVAGAGILRHDATTAPLLVVLIALAVGAVFAWGIWPQLATVGIASAALVWNVYEVPGAFGPRGYDSILVVIAAMVLSVWIAHRRQLFRIEAARENLERQRNAAQRASEEHFAALVQHSSDIVVIEGPDAVSRYVSPAIQRVLGHAPENLIGKNTFSCVHPDDLPRIQVLFRTLAAQPRSSVSAAFRARHACGSWVHIEATATNLLDHPQIQGLVVHARDVTDRTRAEEAVRQRDAELAHVLRVTTMGELAAGLAHEINQPLAAIVNYANGCTRRLVGDDEKTAGLRAAVEKIANEALRAGEVIRRLRDLVRKEPRPRQRADLNQLVREAVHFVERESRECGIELRLDLTPVPVVVDVDTVQIQQVILNLVRNGLDAIREAANGLREVRVQTQRTGAVVELSVTDTGPGFPEGDAERIFDPFFTTKSKGLGMGLSISRSIVEGHGGRLLASTGIPRGATVGFTLPTADESNIAPRGPCTPANTADTGR